jgi:hypothetical protein
VNEQAKAIAKALSEAKEKEMQAPPISIPLAGGLFGIRPMPEKRGVSIEYMRRF